MGSLLLFSLLSLSFCFYYTAHAQLLDQSEVKLLAPAPHNNHKHSHFHLTPAQPPIHPHPRIPGHHHHHHHHPPLPLAPTKAPVSAPHHNPVHAPASTPKPPVHPLPHTPSHLPRPPSHFPHHPSHLPHPPSHLPDTPAHAPSPSRHLPPRTLVAVQGVVYCKSCKYTGVHTLLGASPLSGAVVKLVCTNTKYHVVMNATTDKNGYFYMDAPKTITSYGAHKCLVSLVSSPSKTCSVKSDLHAGLKGALLMRQEKPKKPQPGLKLEEQRAVFSVGPFAFEPKKC